MAGSTPRLCHLSKQIIIYLGQLYRTQSLVGSGKSHLPVRSVLLLRRGVHRTPAPVLDRQFTYQLRAGTETCPYNIPNYLNTIISNAVPTLCTLRFAFCIYPDNLRFIKQKAPTICECMIFTISSIHNLSSTFPQPMFYYQ